MMAGIDLPSFEVRTRCRQVRWLKDWAHRWGYEHPCPDGEVDGYFDWVGRESARISVALELGLHKDDSVKEQVKLDLDDALARLDEYRICLRLALYSAPFAVEAPSILAAQ
jgi:hypothetical protein